MQGPFSIAECLTENQITLDSVIKKIEITKKKLDLYLDVQMQAYRKKHKRKGRGDGF